MKQFFLSVLILIIATKVYADGLPICPEVELIIDSEDAEHFLTNISDATPQQLRCQFNDSIEVLTTDLHRSTTRNKALEVLDTHASTITSHSHLAAPKSLSKMIKVIHKLSTTNTNTNKNRDRSESIYRILR